MKVLFVIDSLGAGGAERSTAALLPILLEKGVDVAVATLYRAQEGSEQEVRDAGIALYEIEALRLPGRVRELRRVIGTERPDVVHTALFAADIAGRLAAVSTSAEVVSSLTSVPRARRDGRRGPLPWKLRVVDVADTVTARLLTTRLHAVTGGVARLTEEEHPLLRGRVSVVERGRSEEELGGRTLDRRAETRASLGLGLDTPVLLAIGRQEHSKAHVDLIAGLEVLLERVPDAQLLIAGRRGIATPTIEAVLSERTDIAAHVQLLGHRSDVGDLLVAADVMVSSSLHEGAAGVVIEAMALSTPIVSTEVEGLEGVLEHEVNALLVPIRDPSAMAAAIGRLLGDRALGKRLAERGRRDFEERFTIEQSADRMLDLYTDVIAQKAGMRRRPATSDVSPREPLRGADRYPDERLAALRQLLVDVGGSNGQWSLVSWEQRRTCDILVLDEVATTRGADRIVVKRFHGPNSDLGRRTLEALETARRSLAHAVVPGLRVSVVAGRAASTDPPAVAMAHVDGQDLHEILASSNPTDLLGLRSVFFGAGRILAALHYHWPRAELPSDPGPLLEPLRHQLRLRAGDLPRFFDIVRPVPSMIDFAPNNLRVDDHSLFVLDPPLLDRSVTCHEDVAHFVGQLRHHLERNPALRRREVATAQHELAGAFLDGYRTAVDVPTWTSRDDDLVSFFAAARSAVWAVKYWNRGQRRSAIRLGSLAVASRVSRRVRSRSFLGT